MSSLVVGNTEGERLVGENMDSTGVPHEDGDSEDTVLGALRELFAEVDPVPDDVLDRARRITPRRPEQPKPASDPPYDAAD
jgi:hypothetical protein